MNRFGLFPENDPYQQLRLKRFLMATLVYGVAIGLKAVYAQQGLMAWRSWAGLSAAILVVNLVLFAILRSGRNERLRDPSLTAVQMVLACLLMMATLYLADGARGALLLLYLVLLMFGVFRLRSWQFTALGVLALVCYGGAIMALLFTRPTAVELHEELLQLAALTVMIPCGGYFAGYVDDLRRQLKGRQIDLQRARERVHDLSVLDPLTGLTNRGSLVSAVAEEVERGHRLEQPLALILLDLDGFKAINREHGHEVGDRILQQVAESLGERLRAIDTVGRYGGEEFLVALPDMEVREAERQAEALRRRLQRCRLSDEEGMPAITVSVGVAELHEGEGTWDLIGRVRAAADTATERGGDRVVTAEEDRAPTTPG